MFQMRPQKNWRSGYQLLSLASYASSCSVSETNVTIAQKEERSKHLKNNAGALESGNVFRQHDRLSINADDNKGNDEHEGRGTGKESVQRARATNNKYIPFDM